MKKRLRSDSGLIAWMNQTTRPLIALDPRGRVRFFNQGAEAMTGCHPEDVLGKSCEYRTETTGSLSERVLAALAPPPEVFAGDDRVVTTHFIDSRGRRQTLKLLYFALRSDDEHVSAVLAMQIDAEETVVSRPAPASQQFHAELSQLLSRRDGVQRQMQLVAKSAAMQRVSTQINAARSCRVPVHLQGPSGSGRKMLARMILTLEQKQFTPLAVLDCRSLSRIDFKRMLDDCLGFAAEAEDPTGILLEHVDELETDLQSHVLEMREKRWPETCRLLSSAAHDLDEARQQEQVLEPLFYLLTAFVIEVPSLVERRADLDLLVQLFVEQNNRGRARQLSGVDRQVREALLAYSWPGEARELHETIDAACQACEETIVKLEHLPFGFHSGQQADAALPVQQETFRPLEESLNAVERTEIERALAYAKDNKAKAADLLGLTRAKFYRRLEALGIASE
ncbi:sigma 54-interacting transcriptional regulator [Rubinisphaera margarita]|uniref:sigma 54-interacting transcriptional regulator n=1 Tax=Rubinisphaera margarita TaxID=2909586 RepID=UPI001EE84BEC|nr:sigma 54-interacting transcriptional regulator [Rubinisphaera margarita]MCG6154354.1 sigma 54-interacting transcriptional regulator [Rubinisphaera margarita]